MRRKNTLASLLVYTAALMLVLAAFAGCAAPGTINAQKAYVEADRETFEVVAPVIRLLVDNNAANDPVLSEPNGSALLQLIESWELRIEKAEAATQTTEIE